MLTCAAGIPEPVPDHAVKIIKAAIKMRGEIKRLCKRTAKGNLPGKYESACIANAGVTFPNALYDVWGNTVNVASRMETYGEAGASTYRSNLSTHRT